MEPNGSPLGPEILPKSIKSQTKALEALITKSSEKLLEKVSLQTPPGPLKSSKIMVGCVKNRRSLYQVFLGLRCPSWPPFGSIFSELGHKSSMRTVKSHCEKTLKNTHTILSRFYTKKLQKGVTLWPGDGAFSRPEKHFERNHTFSQKWCPNVPNWVPKPNKINKNSNEICGKVQRIVSNTNAYNRISVVWGGGDDTPHGVFD